MKKMITIIQNQNILNDNADVLVNPVNCVGVMGKGLALQFKEKYPEILNPYKKACRENRLLFGNVLSIKTNQNNTVLCIPTKYHYNNYSTLANVFLSINAMLKWLEYNRRVKSIAIPKLGCGLGELNWHDVYYYLINAIEEANMHDIDYRIYI